MDTHQSDLEFPPLKPSKLGGLNHLERLLGLRQDAVLSTDAIIVSFDLEVASDRQKLHLSSEKPLIKELAFARLDTRDIHSLSSSSDLRCLISVNMFKTRASFKPKKEYRQCGFAPTQYITQDEVPSIIHRNLLITDGSQRSGNSRLRNIVLVGHSIREDLRILRLIDINISGVAPLLTILDTHTMSRFTLPPYHPSLFPGPNQSFSLAGVLAQFGCHPHPAEFHNAGNDAVYTLYAMLFLAISRGAKRITEPSESESKNLEIISRAVAEAVGKGLVSKVSDKQSSTW